MSAWRSEPLPSPVFGCQNDYCSEDASYPPEDLHFWDGRNAGPIDPEIREFPEEPGWYCDYCLDDRGVVSNGPSLDECLEVKDCRS